jgi:hypothetical protein
MMKFNAKRLEDSYSHSVVPGGFGVKSYSTLDMPETPPRASTISDKT